MTSTFPRLSHLLFAMFCRRALPLFAVLSILSAAAAAQATTIADWTFETSQPATAGPFSPEVGSGSASGSHAGATVYSSPAGDESAHSFSSTLWAVGDYYQFEVSTTNLNDIMLSYEQTSSNTGPRDYQLEYSTDGINFSNFGSVYQVIANAAPDGPWSSGTVPVPTAYDFAVDLTSVSAVDNAANVYFRLADADTTSAIGGTVATAGTDRVDNFTVTGSPVSVPEPGSVLLAVLGACGLGLFSVCRRPA
jgi:hypothetical protein